MGHVRGRVARNCRGCGPTAFAHLRPYARHVGQGPPRTRTRVCVPLRAPTGSTLAPRCTRSAKVCPRPDTRSVTRADPEESGRWYRTSPPSIHPFQRVFSPDQSFRKFRQPRTYARWKRITVPSRFAFIAYGLSRKGCVILDAQLMCVRCLNTR